MMNPISIEKSSVDDVELWTIACHTSNITVIISTIGATIQSLNVPDLENIVGDIVLGFDQQDIYHSNEPYFGCIVGRVANRIQGGTFQLNGNKYVLPMNNGPNCLHGGVRGFNKYVWEAVPTTNGVSFSMVSEDGDEGFPGTLQITATYTLSPSQLDLDLVAVAEKGTTPVNLAQHSYFNLSGHEVEEGNMATIYDHMVQINAEKFTPVDEELIPTGEIKDVIGTVMDFTTSSLLGPRLKQMEDSTVEQTANTSNRQVEEVEAELRGSPIGYDHNYVLRDEGMQVAAVVAHPPSGRVLTVSTDAPGVQFYTANFLDKVTGKVGCVYGRHSGLCLETQHFPSSVCEASPITDAFRAIKGATPIISPEGPPYKHSIRYSFSTM